MDNKEKLERLKQIKEQIEELGLPFLLSAIITEEDGISKYSTMSMEGIPFLSANEEGLVVFDECTVEQASTRVHHLSALFSAVKQGSEHITKVGAVAVDLLKEKEQED